MQEFECRFSGNFCNHCGQKFHVGRINFQYLKDEFSRSILQVNHGFFYTVKELFLRPGTCLKNYIKGKRKQYFKPLPYLLITSAFYVFITQLFNLNTFAGDISEGFTIGLAGSETEDAAAILATLKWLSKHYVYAVLITLPLFSLGSYIVFIKSKLNFFEHFMINIFISSQKLIIYLISIFIVSEDSFTESIPLILGTLYHFWAYFQFFNKFNAVIRIILTLLTFVLFIIQSLIFLILIFGLMNLN